VSGVRCKTIAPAYGTIWLNAIDHLLGEKPVDPVAADTLHGYGINLLVVSSTAPGAKRWQGAGRNAAPGRGTSRRGAGDQLFPGPSRAPGDRVRPAVQRPGRNAPAPPGCGPRAASTGPGGPESAEKPPGAASAARRAHDERVFRDAA
jgi:hypothetical protein